MHSLPAFVTCKCLRLSATACCTKGHHATGHVDRCLLSKVCQLHGLPPCPRCALMQRGFRHCCGRGHHKMVTPGKALAKGHHRHMMPHTNDHGCTLQQSTKELPCSLHIPPTPLAPKRRRPKSPNPPSLPAPLPQGMLVDDGANVVRALFSQCHGRVSSEVTWYPTNAEVLTLVVRAKRAYAQPRPIAGLSMLAAPFSHRWVSLGNSALRRLKRSARVVQLFGRLAVLETHTLRY